MDTAKLIFDGKEFEFPIITGTEGETAIDISTLRQKTGLITMDTGYGNTGSCESAITFIDGEKGILHYRGYPIEMLARNSNFIEVSYLLIYGHLPTPQEMSEYKSKLIHHSLIPEEMKKYYDGIPSNAHPMGTLSFLVSALTGFYSAKDDGDLNIIRLIAKIRVLAAYIYKKLIHQPFIYPRNDLSYAADFLNMMYAVPTEQYEIPKVLEDALDLLLILHADHEQNCSTSTVRMVGSSEANLFSAISAGISALWGKLHGGANQAVLEMLEMIQKDGGNYKKYVDLAKDKNSSFRLMGFGHRVYKNFDPRATILKESADKVLALLGKSDPLLDIAKNLERVALEDSYFIEKKLYPNVDFYSGIIYRAMGIPTEMFTVMFALGRVPGWIAHWKEMRSNLNARIYRPRQIYIGSVNQKYIPIADRK